MRWLAKSAVQNSISVMPGATRVNGLLQRYGTRSIVLTPEKVVAKLARVGGRHLENHRRFGLQPLAETATVEIGTGFVPLLPVGLFLAGAGPVHTFDIVELATARQAETLLEHVLSAAGDGSLERECPWVRADRLARLRELAARGFEAGLRPALARIGITYWIGDAAESGLAPGSIGLFVTNNVFEHIPAAQISRILAEAHRTGISGALLSHHIDLRDHYAKFDRRVGVYNSLRFTARQWRLLNSRMEPQNRLRHSDYLRLVEEAGFEVLADESRPGPDADFAKVRPAPEFRGYAEDDLRIVDMWIAARRRD